MHITAFAVSMLLASFQAVNALGDKNTVESQCKKITKLTRITNFAANDTLLTQKFGTDQARIDDFKAQAVEANTMLQELKANATLSEQCPPIFAAQADGERCKTMAKFEKMVKLAANETNLQAEFEGNTTEIAEFKAKLPERTAKLATLQSNGTLSVFCAARSDRIACKQMIKLEGNIEMSHNTTALMAKFEGNTTKILEFQERTAKMQAKLDAITANTTLMATCNSLPQAGTDNSQENGNGAAAPDGASGGVVDGGQGVGSGVSNGGVRNGGTAEAVRSLGLRIGGNMGAIVTTAMLAAGICAFL